MKEANTPLEEAVLERIRTQGRMPFAAFMQMALYHPRHGYYASGARRTGWRGHFLTSPELDPAFGTLWARGFEHLWEVCGRPTAFEVAEVGPAEGGFAAAVLGAAEGSFAQALSYRLVERVPEVEGRQRSRLEGLGRLDWSRSIVDVPRIEHGCIFANEVLDNLPVHLVEARGGRILEVCIEAEDGRLVERLRPPSNPELEAYIERCGIGLPDGHRMEIGLAAESFVRRASSALGTGALVVVDYGHDALRLAELPAGTLLCYSGSGIDDQYLQGAGDKDITSHVNWTAVAGACRAAGLEVWGPAEQRDVLRALGIRDLDLELKDRHAEAVAAGHGSEALSALSRRQALAALVDPGGLGGLQVLAATRGLTAPAFMSRREESGL